MFDFAQSRAAPNIAMILTFVLLLLLQRNYMLPIRSAKNSEVMIDEPKSKKNTLFGA